MPLFPPGGKHWDNVEAAMVSEKPTPMFWPPNSWTTLSPEEKLTAWTFAAFTLDREQGNRFCIKERDILKKYSMLALPTSRVTVTRAANHNKIVNIYKGNIRGQEAEGLMQMFESATTGRKYQDKLVQALKDVPLRIATTQ